MKTIPQEFRREGFTQKLVSREADVAIYSLTGEGRLMGYEVMRIRRHKRTHVFPNGGVINEGDEYLPATNEWGSYGWSYLELSAAEAKKAALLPK